MSRKSYTAEEVLGIIMQSGSDSMEETFSDDSSSSSKPTSHSEMDSNSDADFTPLSAKNKKAPNANGKRKSKTRTRVGKIKCAVLASDGDGSLSSSAAVSDRTPPSCDHNDRSDASEVSASSEQFDITSSFDESNVHDHFKVGENSSSIDASTPFSSEKKSARVCGRGRARTQGCTQMVFGFGEVCVVCEEYMAYGLVVLVLVLEHQEVGMV